MITEAQWDKLPDLRKELAAQIDDPRAALANALYIVERKLFTPAAKDGWAQPPAGTSLTDFYSLLGARREGYLEALQNLRDLAQTRRSVHAGGQKPFERTPNAGDDAVK